MLRNVTILMLQSVTKCMYTRSIRLRKDVNGKMPVIMYHEQGNLEIHNYSHERMRFNRPTKIALQTNISERVMTRHLQCF